MSSAPFLDARLVACIGPVADDVARAIDAEVHEAVMQVVGHLLEPSTPLPAVVPAVAPWAYDLGRGLHWHARRGTTPITAELISVLAPSVATTATTEVFARDVDITWALVHGRYTNQIFGPGAVRRPSSVLRDRCPWFDAAVTGHRIDLVLEFARLSDTLQ